MIGARGHVRVVRGIGLGHASGARVAGIMIRSARAAVAACRGACVGSRSGRVFLEGEIRRGACRGDNAERNGHSRELHHANVPAAPIAP